jgi:hypothetical protein
MEIITDASYITAQAERGKFWQLDPTYLSSLGYPASGAGKYAVLTYNVNPITVDISGSDIQIGSVEIKDGTTDTRVTVQDGSTMPTSANAMAVADPNVLAALQNLDVSSATEQVPDSPANTKVVQLGGIAESTVPTAVADGDAVAMWLDTYGRQIIAGFNNALAAIDTNQVNQATLNRLGPVDIIPAGTKATYTSSSIDVSNYHNYTLHIITSGYTSGATIEIQHSLGGTNWTTLSSTTTTQNGVIEYAITHRAYKYIRAVISSYTDGTLTEAYNVQLFAGN